MADSEMSTVDITKLSFMNQAKACLPVQYSVGLGIVTTVIGMIALQKLRGPGYFVTNILYVLCCAAVLTVICANISGGVGKTLVWVYVIIQVLALIGLIVAWGNGSLKETFNGGSSYPAPNDINAMMKMKIEEDARRPELKGNTPLCSLEYGAY